MDVSLPDGSVMPMALSAQQLQSMGHQPAAIPPIQLLPGQLRGLPPNAVAGPGGAPTDLGSPDAAVRMAAGNGQGPQMTPIDMARLTAPPRTDRSHVSAPSSKFDAGPASSGAPVAPELAAHSTPRDGVAQPSGPSPEAEQAFKEAVSGGAGKTVPYLKDEKVKYTAYGQVPGALTAGIADKQAALDDEQQGNLSEHHYEETQYEQQRQQQYEQQLADVQEQRAQRVAVNAKLQELQTTRDQREQQVANMKPPEMADYFASRSTMSNVMTGISIALGGALQGLRGGANPGLQMANEGIDRWINEQKEAFSRASGAADRADSQYAQALKIYGTPELAENDMRARAYAARDSLMKNELDKIGTQDAFQKGDEILKQGQIQRDQLRAQAYQLSQERAVEDTIGSRIQGTNGKYLQGLRAASEATDLSRNINNQSPKGQESKVVLPDGSFGFAADASEAAKLRDQADGAAEVASLARSIKRDVATLGDRTDPETRARILARLPALKIAIAKQQNVPLRGAGEYLDAQVGSPEDLVNIRTNPGARLDALAAEADHKINIIKSHRLSTRPLGQGGEVAPAAPAASSERLEEE